MKALPGQPPLMRALESPPSHSRLFAQVPLDLIHDRNQPAGALAVYCHLDALAVEHAKDAWSTSVRQIARDLSLRKSTAVRAVSWLIEQDYLRRAPSDYRYQTTFLIVQRAVPLVVTTEEAVPLVVTGGSRGGHYPDRTSSLTERSINKRQKAHHHHNRTWLSTPADVDQWIASRRA